MKTKEFVLTSVLFILLYETYDLWWYQYKATSYLSDFKDSAKIRTIKKSIRKKLVLEFGISLLFYPIYFLNENLLLTIVVMMAIYFQAFHYGFDYYYLPKLILELNKDEYDTPT